MKRKKELEKLDKGRETCVKDEKLNQRNEKDEEHEITRQMVTNTKLLTEDGNEF